MAAALSALALPEQREEHQHPIRSSTYFGVAVLSALATSSCARRSRGPKRARRLRMGIYLVQIQSPRLFLEMSLRRVHRRAFSL
jgi:hypothetical protein